MKIGILGAGVIAKVMAKTLNKMNNVECYAIAARDFDKAKNFADEFGFTKAYGSYEEMVKDKEVELVYIATPHSHHYEHMMLCLNNNKNILCEKAFTANAKEAKEVLELAKSKNLFVTEAIWTRFMPMREKLNEIIESGIIGEVTSLTANLGYVIDNIERLIKPELAGGALLDLGVYTINFASMVFGDNIKNITSTAVLTESGVDCQNSITITYNDGKMAVLHTNMMALTDRQGIIYGRKGYIVVENINNCEKIKVYSLERKEIANYERPQQITGYEYEVLAAMKAIKNGKIECDEMPHTETIKIMEIMDSLRKEWGVVFPFEK